MYLRRYAFVMTLLMGTHAAQSVIQDEVTRENPPTLQKTKMAQGYGSYGGYYGGGYGRDSYAPWRYGPGGYYEPRYNDYYSYRGYTPESTQRMQRWNWESDQYGRYNNPPWAGRSW